MVVGALKMSPRPRTLFIQCVRISLLIVLAAANTAAEDKESKKFVATDEWQEIKPGQNVPAGLHYRINLQTGKKEARFLDVSAEDSNVSQQSGGGLMVSQDARKDEPNLTDETEGKTIKKTNRYLKDMEFLMARFNNSTDQRKLEILQDLGDYMHQVENAIDFVKLRGLQSIVIPCLKKWSDPSIPAGASILLGSACQNNIPVKTAALSLGIVELLAENVQRASSVLSESDVPENHYSNLHRRTIFALSSVLRDHSAGIDRFLEIQGFHCLLDNILLLKRYTNTGEMNGKEATENRNRSLMESRVSLKIKCLNLVANVWKTPGSSEEAGKGVALKIEAQLKERMDDGWCRVFVVDRNLYSTLDLSGIGALARALNVFCPFCSKHWASKTYIINWLNEAEDTVELSSSGDDDEDYKEYLTKTKMELRDIRNSIFEYGHQRSKSEL